MKVFVAGATGALGRALVPRLVEDRHVVRVEPVDADLVVADLPDLLRGCDAVVDLATAACRTATQRLLDAAVACRVPRYVHQSFATVYRDGGDRWLDEDAPLNETAGRAVACRSAIEAEAMIRQIDPETVAWTILRGGSFVGARTRQDTLIARLRSRSAMVVGDGSNYLSLVNVDDMASAITAALRYAPAGSTFNIVDEPLRYSDYIDALADLIGVARPPRAAAGPLRSSRRCKSSAARAALGWMPRRSIWPSRRPAAS